MLYCVQKLPDLLRVIERCCESDSYDEACRRFRVALSAICFAIFAVLCSSGTATAQGHSMSACRDFQNALYDSLLFRTKLSRSDDASVIFGFVQQLRSSIVEMKGSPYFLHLHETAIESVPSATTVGFISETKDLLQHHRKSVFVNRAEWQVSAAMQDVAIVQLCDAEEELARADSGLRVLDYAVVQNANRTISSPRSNDEKTSRLGFTSGSMPAAIFLAVLVLALVPALMLLDKMEHRTARRYKLSLETLMVLDGRETIAFITDLSRSGAKLKSAAVTERDARIVLQVRNHEIPARVVWAGGGHIGLQFASQLSNKVIKKLRRSKG